MLFRSVLVAVEIISKRFLTELALDKMNFFKNIEPQYKVIDEDKEMEAITMRINQIINEISTNDH